jgi:hypothetical protein
VKEQQVEIAISENIEENSDEDKESNIFSVKRNSVDDSNEFGLQWDDFLPSKLNYVIYLSSFLLYNFFLILLEKRSRRKKFRLRFRK